MPYVHTLGDTEDFLYATTDIAIWSCSETGLGITAACCAVLRPLFRQALASGPFLSSKTRFRDLTLPSHGDKRESRRGYKRSLSSNYVEAQEVTLQSPKAHGQPHGKDGRGFGTTASAWHADEDGRIAEEGTGPLEAEIIVTRTRQVISF